MKRWVLLHGFVGKMIGGKGINLMRCGRGDKAFKRKNHQSGYNDIQTVNREGTRPAGPKNQNYCPSFMMKQVRILQYLSVKVTRSL